MDLDRAGLSPAQLFFLAKPKHRSKAHLKLARDLAP